MTRMCLGLLEFPGDAILGGPIRRECPENRAEVESGANRPASRLVAPAVE